MADSGFVYQADDRNGEYLVFNSSSEYDSEFDYIRNLLEGVDYFPDALDLKIYPEGYPDSPFEMLVRSRLAKGNYLLPAALFDKDFELISFLLVDKKDFSRALVISKKKDVLADIHGNFLFAESYAGEVIAYSMRDFMDEALDKSHDMSLVKGAAYVSSSISEAVAKEKKEKEALLAKQAKKVEKKKDKVTPPPIYKPREEEEEEEYVAPKLETTFTPVSSSSKKKKIILLPEEQKRKEAIKPKPAPAKVESLLPKQEEKKPETSEPSAETSFEKPHFEANKKRDFRKINIDPVEPKKAEIPAKPQENDEKEVSIPEFEKVFSIQSKLKKKAMDHIPASFFNNSWQQAGRITYSPDHTRGESTFVINATKGERSLDLSFYLKKDFNNPRKVEPHKSCLFVPEIPEPTDELPNSFLYVSLQKFYFLGAYLDIYHKPYSYLIASKEDPKRVAVLSKGKYGYFFFAISSIGAYIRGLDLTSDDLLPRCYPEDFPEEAQKLEEKPKEAPAEEVVTKKEAEPKPLPKKEEKLSISIKDNRRANAVERRKIYYTPHFKSKFDAFLEEHRAKGQKDFDDFLFNLQTLKEEELEQYFRRKQVKRIQFSKMHLSNDSEYSASRIFYLTHDQFEELGRKIEPKAMVLFAFSTHQEHEIQSEVEAKGLAALQKDSTILCYPSPRSEKEEEKLYVLSSDQNSQLERSTSSLPSAVLGAAGSGKTIMSYQAYMELCAHEDEKVLYVTYQRKLKDKANTIFEEMGARNTTVLTFKELMRVIHVDDEGLRPVFKDEFHDWFFSRKEKDFVNRINIISSNKEDAFATAYVFYRGVIEGSLKNVDKKDNQILSRKEFKDEVEGEFGLSLEQKDAIYDIALAYERHLKEANAITDNKYALRLVKEQKRDIFDAIVVDEYQDLTELQLFAIAKVLKPGKPHKLLLFGDDNQAVNPTILNVTGINRVFFKAFGEKINYISLNSTYRTGKSLFTYIVDVLSVKNQAIGMDRSENTIPTHTFRDDEQDLYITLLDKPSYFETLLFAAKNSNLDAVFIFPSAAKRDEAKKKYGSIIDDDVYLQDNFLSVEESKGMEWDSCILVDFISSSKEVFEAMLGEERAGHRSTLHRMLFNRYYVALTRAENRIVVFESDAGPNAKQRLLKPLTKLKTKADIEKIFTGNLDPTYWISHGDDLFLRGKYEEAYRAYRRGHSDESSPAKQEKALAYIKANEIEALSEEVVDLFLHYDDVDSLYHYYERVNAPKRLRLLETFRNEEASTLEKSKAFKKTFPILFDSEKVLFFRDLCLLRKQEIENLLETIEE